MYFIFKINNNVNLVIADKNHPFIGQTCKTFVDSY